MSTIEVKVPDIGDFKDVPVIEVFVKPGDAVKAEDSLVTLESDKATMDVPAPKRLRRLRKKPRRESRLPRHRSLRLPLVPAGSFPSRFPTSAISRTCPSSKS